MKFLIDARTLAASPHGIARYVRALTKFLPIHLTDWDLHALVANAHWAHTLGDEGWKVTASNLLPYSPAETWKLGKLIDAVGADFTHIPTFGVPRRCRTPFAVTIHDLLHFSDYSPHPIRNRLYFALILRPALQYATHIFVDTTWVAQQIRRIVPHAAPCSPIYLGGDMETVPWPSTDDKVQIPTKPYVLVLANGRPHKNLKVLLQAMTMPVTQVKFVIAGEVSPSEARLLADLPASKALYFPHIQDHALTSLIKGSAGLLFPSLDEGFGLPVLEALTLGKPVAAADIPVLREWVGDCALWVPPDDAAAWQAAAQALIDGSAPAPSGPLADGRPAAEWTWSRCVERTVAVYRDIMQ